MSYCTCRHHRQVHECPTATLCRGRCVTHNLDDHTGRCTARCQCERFGARR